MVLMDVTGAYDNALHARLLHNLQKRRLGTLVPWISAFLTGRSTRIRMAEGVSEAIPTTTGIPQGSPLSPILYQFYNADLIEDCSRDGVVASGWVDDVSLITEGKTEEDNIRRLKAANEWADLWARRHASVFDHKKYKLIHFINPNTDVQPRHTALPLENVTVHATKDAERYLGIWLDPELTFEKHREKAVAKAGTSLQAIRGLAGSTWGASLTVMWRLYQAIIIPQMLHGIAAWFQPATAKQRDTITRKFAKIQHRAACLISGGTQCGTTPATNEAADGEDVQGDRNPDPYRTQVGETLRNIRTTTGSTTPTRRLDTNGGAGLEKGWQSYGSPGNRGRRMGESQGKGIPPGTMARTSKGDYPRRGQGDHITRLSNRRYPDIHRRKWTEWSNWSGDGNSRDENDEKGVSRYN